MEIQIKEVTTSSQVDIVAGLAKAIWPEHYIPIIGKEQVDFMLGKFQTSKAILAQIGQEGNHYFLIYHDFVPVGYIGIIEKYNEIFLSKLYLTSTERGKGIGHKAIDFLIARCREIGAVYITLTVNKENLNTISAYESIGFETYGELVSDIGSGFVMDDYMMRLRISPR
jgi:ribosomal protein S18 acetylase RimI-like enzyme